MKKYYQINLLLLIMTGIFNACNTPRQGLFAKKTPHEQYLSQLINAGLINTTLGQSWVNASLNSINRPIKISLPYRETGYFQQEFPAAAGYVFAARQGEKISVQLTTNPAGGILIFTDLWTSEFADKKWLASGDTLTHTISYAVEKNGDYLVRIQPELLEGVSYTITISTGPTLAFPVLPQYNPKVQSVWGDSRDANARKHEGIDIFAKKGTPTVAIANGYVTSVREGGIGGKVVFMRPEGTNINLYYAHLDSQLVTAGATVKTGDVLGRIGNTGNAKYTAAHLHFGIYTNGGAVDPYPFVNNNRPSAKTVKSDTALLRSHARTKRSLTAGSKKIVADQLVKILAAVDEFYRVQLPDSNEVLIKSSDLTVTPIRTEKFKKLTPVYTAPNISAPMKVALPAGSSMRVMGLENDFLFIAADSTSGWIKQSNGK